MKTKNFILLILLSVVLLNPSNDLKAFDKSFGLQAQFQSGPPYPYLISVPIFINDNLVISPGISYIYEENAQIDLGIILAPKYYLKTDKVSPYISVIFGTLFNIPKKGESTTDLIAGFAFGGEYFIDSKFSLGVEAQLIGTKSNQNSVRFGNPGGFNLNTAMAILASVYF